MDTMIQGVMTQRCIQKFDRNRKDKHFCNKPEAEMESVVGYHLYWLITGSNNVWAVDKNSKTMSGLLNLN